jgi:1,4-alpha-glucan branching enzyme
LPVDQVIANCTATAEHFAPRGWQSQVVWPGVNEARLRIHPARNDLAARYNIPTNRPWVTMCARLQRHKGQPHFLKTIAEVSKTHDIQGVLVGAALFGMEEEYAEELRQMAREFGIADRVTFTGFISDEDVAGFQAAAGVLLHTALLEDFGLVLAEANTLGVPAVAFAAVGPAAIIVPGETGWLAPVGDQAALDAALADALASPDKRARFGAAAQSRMRERFTIEEHVRQTEAIYARLTNR